MKTKLFFIRKIKALFSKFRLDLVFLPFFGLFQNLIYLAKLSKWISQNRNLGFNDFYNSKVNYNDRFKLHEFVYNSENLDDEITFIEFGVASGIAFKWWKDKNTNSNSKFFGFDTFTGLPEDFGVMKKNDYDTEGNFPEVNDSRCSFFDGLFQNTLPSFLSNFNRSDKLIIHMDADLYSSTLFVLTMIKPFLKSGDIIIFDEFGVPTHEFRAFTDFTSSYYLDFEVLGAVNNYLQVAFRVK